ncbi:hypothetical protein BJ912DRAFT_860528 [Pholiota molesta]|nr:hypothetical protein BJ912DRAFT_860528 [Pholiota molesta]
MRVEGLASAGTGLASETRGLPVRITRRWKVRWWRGCNFASPGITPDTTTIVTMGDIVDSLWRDRSGRRAIRLGKWLHSWNVKTPEDILADPSTIPYTQQISDALSPLVDILKRLLKAPDTVDSETVPAKAWMDKSKMDVKKELVPFVRSLSLTERAQISNWFEAHVSKNKNLRHKWLGRLPIAHAHTLYILKSVKADPKNKGLTQNMLLEKAWDVQFSGTPSALIDTDVDKECLEILEEEMFEKSARAGIAGHYQWGLDAGQW